MKAKDKNLSLKSYLIIACPFQVCASTCCFHFPFSLFPLPSFPTLMSDENQGLFRYNNDPFYHDHQRSGTGDPTSFPFDNFTSMYTDISHLSHPQTLNEGLDPSINYGYMSFTDYLHGSSMDYPLLSKAFDISCSSSEVISDGGVAESGGGHGCEKPPHSSVSSSSMEAVVEEEAEEDSEQICATKEVQQPNGSDPDVDVNTKIASKPKRKGETKKQKEPRYAFMTKSEIDNLEDGYKWRKYGQKAVKNSPYPRSYYRCTTQKCSVKKRVERSFQDPSTVITTYEGQHNHHCPVTLRGNATGLLSQSFFPSPAASSPLSSSVGFGGISRELLGRMLPADRTDLYYQNLNVPPQQLPSAESYGLLQDMVPPFLQKREP